MTKKKILGLAVFAMTAVGLAACGETTDPNHKHKYVEDQTQRVEATCTTEGKKISVCECGDKKEETIKVKAHTYVDDATGVNTPATCTEKGKKAQKCSVCNATKEVEVAALGHSYVKKADQTGAKAATCLAAGEELQECERCKDPKTEPVAALGHKWVDDEDQAGAEAPACVFSGEKLQHCERCSEPHKETVTATGHSFGTPTETAKDGDCVAYKTEFCAKDNVTRVTWAAADVTTECATPNNEHVAISGEGSDTSPFEFGDKLEPHIDEKADGGIAFWGRAIGNGQVLDDTGSAQQNSHKAYPDENVEGSYFEYKIKTAALTSVRLVAYLAPADYISDNDIWRAAGAANDWTPGYQKGTDGQMHIVNDWRYVITIDNQQIQLDNTVTTKIIGGGGSGTNNPANWYTVPMDTMNLTEGEHVIRISMAGGYRHIFYNWGFETGIQHKHTVVRGEKAESSALRSISCKCSNLKGYELLASEATEGQTNPTRDGSDKDTRLGKNIYDDKWDISGISAGMYQVFLEARASSANASKGYWNSATAVDVHKDSESNNGGAELCREYKYKIAAHGQDSTPNYINVGNDTDNYADTGIGENEPAWTTKALCTIPVNGSDTTLTLHNMKNGYSLWIYSVRLVKVSDFVY